VTGVRKDAGDDRDVTSPVFLWMLASGEGGKEGGWGWGRLASLSDGDGERMDDCARIYQECIITPFTANSTASPPNYRRRARRGMSSIPTRKQ